MARSTTEGAGSIITNGLDMYLDANNNRSYPGSGATWFDLSGNKNNFTLVNSPTYTGKTIDFNGSTQYASCVNSTFGNYGSNSFTFEYAVNVIAAGSQAAIMMKRTQATNIGTAANPGICDRVGAVQFFVQDSNPGGTSNDNTHVVNLSSIAIGTKAHMIYTIERNGFDATGSRYLNGVLTNVDRKTFIGANSIDNNNTMVLMLGSSQYVAGSIYVMRFYNRALSSTEVKQNYLATKAKANL
jgi:hypothetical protein